MLKLTFKTFFLIVITITSKKISGQSLKEYYIPSQSNFNKANFYYTEYTGERTDKSKVIFYTKNKDGTFDILEVEMLQGQPSSIITKTVNITATEVVMNKSISTGLIETNKKINYEPAKILLKMPLYNQTATWNILNEKNNKNTIYTSSWTTLMIEKQIKKAIKVISHRDDQDFKIIFYYVEGIGLMKIDVVDDGKIIPFQKFDGLSYEVVKPDVLKNHITSNKVTVERLSNVTVERLSNETLTDLLNNCAINCINGNETLNAFALYQLDLTWGISTKYHAAKAFKDAINDNLKLDKILCLFYKEIDWVMEEEFLEFGVKPANCKLLSQFLINNIEAIKKRINSYQEEKDNNSISFDYGSSLDNIPELSNGDFYLKFITDSMQYPKVANEKNIGGKVVLRFTIDINGNASNIEIKEGKEIGYGIPEESIRIIELMKWIPGKKNGNPINIKAEKAIIFRPK